MCGSGAKEGRKRRPKGAKEGKGKMKSRCGNEFERIYRFVGADDTDRILFVSNQQRSRSSAKLINNVWRQRKIQNREEL